MSFIYKITNDINNKVYVGKTNLSIEERFAQHKKDAFKDKNEKRPLYSAMKKYGVNHFYIEQIEECDATVAGLREQYWIGYYNGYSDGYNATLGGDGKLYFNHQLIANRLSEYPYPKQVAEEFHCSSDLVYIIAKEYGISCKNKGSEKNIPAPKQIYQYSKTNEFIQKFNSVVKASEWLKEQGIITVLNSGVRSHISAAARGERKSAYGYIWKYDQ